MTLNYMVYQYDGCRNAVVMIDMEGKQLISLHHKNKGICGELLKRLFCMIYIRMVHIFG